MLGSGVMFMRESWSAEKSVGTNLVPSYASAYLRAGTAEKARVEARVEGVVGRAGRKQRRLALRPASRVRVDAIAVEDRMKRGDVTSLEASAIEVEGSVVGTGQRGRLFCFNDEVDDSIKLMD